MTRRTAAPRRRRWLRIAGAMGLVLALATVLFLAGPVNHFGSNASAPRAVPESRIEALDDWLATTEARFNDLRPGLQKGIVWHTAAHQRTPWSVVYLHGFSASRSETAPLADTLEAVRIGQVLGERVLVIGSAQKTLQTVDYSESRGQHGLAGEIRAPRATAPMAQTIATWVRQQP